jgi:hypothetical protein
MAAIPLSRLATAEGSQPVARRRAGPAWRLTVLTVLLVPFLLSCSFRYEGPAGPYSRAVREWVEGSAAIGRQLQDLERIAGQPAADDLLRLRTLELLARQRALNAGLREAVPPVQWQAIHEGIALALEEFEDWADRRQQEPAALALEEAGSRLARLRRTVGECYAGPKTCRPAAAGAR